MTGPLPCFVEKFFFEHKKNKNKTNLHRVKTTENTNFGILQDGVRQTQTADRQVSEVNINRFPITKLDF